MQSRGQLLLSRHLHHTCHLRPLTSCPLQYSFTAANYTHSGIAVCGNSAVKPEVFFLLLFFKFCQKFLSSDKSTISQIQSKHDLFWSLLFFLFMVYKKTHWHILKEKLKVGVFTWIHSFGISQTTFVSQISHDPLTHTFMDFFISVKFLSFT